MLRIFVLLTCLWTLVLSQSRATPNSPIFETFEVDLLCNGDFEEGTKSWINRQGSFSIAIGGFKPDSTKFAQLTASAFAPRLGQELLSSSSATIHQHVELKPDMRYCFGASVSLEIDTCGDQNVVIASISVGLKGYGSIQSSSPQWKSLKSSFQTKSFNLENEVEVKLEISTNSLSPVSVVASVDDVFLLEDSDCSPNLFPNLDLDKRFRFLGMAPVKPIPTTTFDFNGTKIVYPNIAPPETFEPDDKSEQIRTPDVVLLPNDKLYQELILEPRQKYDCDDEAQLCVGNDCESNQEGEIPFFFNLTEEEFKQSRQIIGSDNRILRSNTNPYPWRSFGAIRYGGAWHGCSGVFVGPRHFLTAAHCLYDRDTNSWTPPVQVVPGQIGCGALGLPGCGGPGAPWGSHSGITRIIPSAYISSGGVSNDYGMVILPDNSFTGCTVGWFGYSTQSSKSSQGTTINNYGYPGGGRTCAASPRNDKACAGWQYGHSCKVKSRTATTLRYTCDTQGGQSGSPMYFFDGNNGRWVVGIHSGFPNSSENWARRMTGKVFDFIQRQKNNYPSTKC